MNSTASNSFHRLVATCLLILLPLGASLADTTLTVSGVKGELKQNIELVVGKPPPAEESRQYRRYIAGLPQQSAAALSALGYYAADVQVSDRRDASSGNTVVSITVTPNDPVRINNIAIQIQGDAQDDPSYTRILDDLPIRKGNIFVSGQYESTKSLLLDQAQDLGYFQFEFSDAAVRVSRRQLTADITLTAVSGPRYTFGDIIFEQNIFSRTFLERWLPFDTGDPYESSLIGELTQNLQTSGYFQSVRVIPQQDRRYGTRVPVKVNLKTRDENEVAVGIGYSTDTRARVKLNWDKPLINRRGHSISTQFGVSRDLQNASIAYRIPRRNEPLFNYWGIEYGLLNDTTGDNDSFLGTLNFQRVSRTSTQWIESIFLRWERETFTAGDNGVEQSTDLVLPGVSYSRSRSKGSPFPTWGQSASFQIMGGSKEALSTIDFLKATGRFRYLRAISDRNTLIGTLQYGVIQSNDYPRVPITQRFFAGGDRSVRGFRYKDISPKNTDGEAVGGRFLEVANIEYNYRFLDLWSAAVFADAGRAFNNYSDGYSVGAGVGLRWQSPVGPFRIDLAVPVNDPDDVGGFRVHLSLGPDL
ncbi:autotransporter assembly complex protein TamA [Granulosicoccus sp. 3-233]|uniref:autotransporter assembly complex protein TamA n=1 Tax=Granulosicoccus sp. 3-233 TaxID=3417969 RepID=UPI003D326821